MSFIPKTLIHAKHAANSDTDEYTVPVGKHTIIDKFTVNNTDSSAQQVWINLVKSTESAGDSNEVVTNLAIAAGEAINIDILKNHILDAGDKISVQASDSNVVVIRASGREVT